jgi:sugar phosphate isomerase/epimerase
VIGALPFGVSQFTTGPQSFEEDLRLFREAEVEFIEVCEGKLDAHDPEPQIQQLKDSGLSVSTVQPRLHSLFPDLPRPEPKLPRERMAALRRTIELFGQHFPGVTLVTISGAAPARDYSLAYRVAVQEYREIARIAADNGVRAALEPLNPILMNADTFLCSIAHAERVVDSVDHPQFGLLLDLWHIWEDSGVHERIRKNAERIFGVHISDWRDPRAIGDRYLPGEGIIPLVDLLRTIRTAGYTSVYTLEIFSESHLSGSLWAEPRRTVIEGKSAFAKIWEKVCD